MIEKNQVNRFICDRKRDNGILLAVFGHPAAGLVVDLVVVDPFEPVELVQRRKLQLEGNLIELRAQIIIFKLTEHHQTDEDYSKQFHFDFFAFTLLRLNSKLNLILKLSRPAIYMNVKCF